MIQKFRAFLDGDLHLKEILLKSSSAFAVKILGVLFSFLFTVLISRHYGASVYGSYALSINFLILTSMIVLLGLDTTLLKYTAHYLELKQLKTVHSIFKKVLWISIPLGIVISISMYFLSDIIAIKVFNKPNLASYFRISSFMILPWSLAMIFAAGIRGFKDALSFTFLKDSSVFFFGSIVILALQQFYGKNDFDPVYSYLVAVIITLIISAVIFRYRINKYQLLETKFEVVTYKQIFDLAIPMLIVVSTYQILAVVNSFMLGMFTTEADVGVYNVAFRISNITLIPLIAINSIAAPKFAECFAKQQYDTIEKIVEMSTKLMFLVSLPLFILCFVFPEWIMSFFGPEFKGYSIVLRLIIIGQVVNVASGSVGILMTLTNLQKEYRNVIVVTTIIIILLNYILIPKYGLTAAAVTSMINLMMINLSCVWIVKRKYNILTLLSPIKNDKRSK